jgi:hypothetical protein
MDFDFEFLAVEAASRPTPGAPPPATEPLMALFEFASGAGGSGFTFELFAATFWTLLAVMFDPAPDASLALSPFACSPRFALAVRTAAIPEFPYRSIKSCVGLFVSEAV